MFGSYSYLMLDELKRDVTQKTLQQLLDDGKYSYKVLMAFITLDDTFGKTTDKRKRRRAKRILRKNAVKFTEIKALVDQSWEHEKKLYQTVQKVMFEKVPGMQVLARYMCR